MDAQAGAGLDQEAALVAQRLEALHDADPDPDSFILWNLATWYVHAGRLPEAERILGILVERSADEADPRNDIFVRSIEARVVLATGDSSRALQLLQAVTPTAGKQGLVWDPSASLGWERLTLAELLLERGQPREALAIASIFDAFGPVIYPIYLPASLELRARAAEELGNPRAATQYRDRLRELASDTDELTHSNR